MDKLPTFSLIFSSSMHPELHEFEKLFQRALHEIDDQEKKTLYLLRLFHDLVADLSEASALHFNSLFARVSYIVTRYQLSKAWSYAFQIVRKELRERKMENEQLLPIVTACIQYLLAIERNALYEVAESKAIIAPALPALPPARLSGRFKKSYARVVAITWDKENNQLTVLDEEEPGISIVLHYREDKNEIYADTLELCLREIGLPLVLSLTDIETTEDNHYIPGFIVVLPDLLMDVTSVASTLSSGGDPLAVNIINQFLPSDSTEAIMTGQVANFFLDELIRNTQIPYKEIFTRSFKIYPIEFVQLSDEKLKDMYKKMEVHYTNIKTVIEEKFPLENIDKSECIIEPSYFSPQYGLKGRLDLYYDHRTEKGASIIELKSGKIFRPNSYGLNHEHYHQTLLYELMIKSVHGPAHHRMNYILYSIAHDQPLRYAVSVESIQKETIQDRNLLTLLQFRLMKLDHEDARDIMNEITPEKYPALKGYVQVNIQQWDKVYSSLSQGEKSYFKSLSAFITREHMLARIGSEGKEGAGGLAGLWLDTIENKEEGYRILRGLELSKIEQADQQTLITFNRTSQTNPLANFRSGDIAIMYPDNPGFSLDPTKYQLHRANVIAVDSENVVIRLRNHQVHTDQLTRTRMWNIEHDLLDSSFRSLFQSLWSFISSNVAHRQLVFGLRKPPYKLDKNEWPQPEGLTDAQSEVYREALDAGPVYFLWGPPGTGKTSRMLKSWVWYYFTHTDSRIALLAYTNKAVDEICEALHELGDEIIQHYIRIGSRAGSGEAFRNRLLDKLIEPLSRRSEIKELLDTTRIFVGTVAAVQGKSEIFKLVSFDAAIIDEASQILEPAMVGLLTRFRKTILIGDHMQLPAVTAQASVFSTIKEHVAWAVKIGMTDMGMSYFERIYRLYQSKGWHHVIGVLSEQGRMHEDIQRFANEYVYKQQLTCLHPESQQQALSSITDDDDILFSKRLLYFPSSCTWSETYQKTNDDEATKTINIITAWQKKIREKNLGWRIGVITPFRAQIAAILHKAHLHETDMKNVSVDTVERYQGGARDIIIMSCSVNNRQFLNRIVSINQEGVDRKLNVAVTRAKQQFILTGCESVLVEEPAYRGLISMCTRVDKFADIEVNS